MTAQRRKRIQLLLIMALFLAPMLVAFSLHLAGWKPGSTRNNGSLVEPAQDLSADTPRSSDAKPFAWRDAEYRWTLLILAGPDCATQCQQRLAEAEKIWSVMTQKATRLRLAALGVEADAALQAKYPRIRFVSSDAPALQALRPTGSDSAVALIIDPAGLLMLRYAPDYDAAHARQDLSRLIR